MAAIEASSGEIAVELAFSINEEGKRVVTGNARGDVSLVCQRCLEPVSVPVECDISLAIVWDEEAAKALPDYLDPWITGEGVADFYEMIEEELLLNLPAVAYHFEPCIDTRLYSSGQPVEVEQLKSSPKS